MLQKKLFDIREDQYHKEESKTTKLLLKYRPFKKEQPSLIISDDCTI